MTAIKRFQNIDFRPTREKADMIKKTKRQKTDVHTMYLVFKLTRFDSLAVVLSEPWFEIKRIKNLSKGSKLIS